MSNPKQQLRRTILAARDALPQGYRVAASQRILHTLYQQPAYREAQTILSYMGFGSEIDTAPVLTRLVQDHKTAVLPRVNRATRTLSLHQVIVGEALIPGPWGILEPPLAWPTIEPTQLDLILVPGVAFDRHANRLGYGGGYYDTLLAAVADKPARIALAFECQLAAAIPVEPHDQPIDCIITENQTIHRPQHRPQHRP